MQRITSLFPSAMLSAAIMVPFFLIYQKTSSRNTAKTIRYFIFSVYLCAVYTVVGMPTVCYIRFDPNFNLIPFAYMFSDLENSLLNVVLFIPLGFCLTTFWRSFHKLYRVLLAGLSFSLLIEFMQLFTFRATDINDLITNTFGAFLGWSLGRLFLHFIPSFPVSRKTSEVCCLFGFVFVIMFFLQPLLLSIL